MFIGDIFNTLLLPVLGYFLIIKFNSKNQNNSCLVCSEKCIDQIETICGHFYCCIFYIVDCWEGKKCVCGHESSIIFTENLNQIIATHNINQSFKNIVQVVRNSFKLFIKILQDTKLKKWKFVWKSWCILIGMYFILVDSYSKTESFLELSIVIVLGSTFSVAISSLAYFYSIIEESAYFLSDFS